MAVDTTPGGASADGYVSVADADAYHADRVDTAAWDGATTGDKEAAIKHSTRLLDLLNWVGSKTFDSGALRWPRDNVFDRDGLALDSQTIPRFLERANAEYALVLLRDGDVTAPPGSAGLERVKVDVLELEFDTEGLSETQRRQGTPDSVLDIIGFYLSGSTFTHRVRRT